MKYLKIALVILIAATLVQPIILNPSTLERRGLLDYVWEAADLGAPEPIAATFGSREKALFDAADARSMSGVRKAMEDGANPALTNDDGQSIYEIAVTRRQRELVNYLLDEKVALSGGDAFHLAIVSEQRDMLKTMLDGGLDPNQRERDGTTPLISAINWGDPELVELLLQYGADPALAAESTEAPSTFVAKKHNYGHFPDVDYNYDKILELLNDPAFKVDKLER